MLTLLAIYAVLLVLWSIVPLRRRPADAATEDSLEATERGGHVVVLDAHAPRFETAAGARG